MKSLLLDAGLYEVTCKKIILWTSFHYHNRNANDIIWQFWDGKNSLFVTQGTIIFPHSRHSSRSKKKFPHSRLRRSWGNLFSLFLLSHSWGKYNVPFVIHGEIYFSPVGNNSSYLVPNFCPGKDYK